MAALAISTDHGTWNNIFTLSAVIAVVTGSEWFCLVAKQYVSIRFWFSVSRTAVILNCSMRLWIGLRDRRSDGVILSSSDAGW